VKGAKDLILPSSCVVGLRGRLIPKGGDGSMLARWGTAAPYMVLVLLPDCSRSDCAV